MPSYPARTGQPTFALLSRCFGFRPEARFTGLLDPAFFQGHADAHRLRFGQGQGDTYNAPVTLWAWLSQVLSGSRSCAAATARVLVLCAGLGRPLPSAQNGAYCKARAKLPEAFLRDLTTDLGRRVEERARDGWRWQGRTVKVVDGSVLLLPDSDANLAEYPQQRSQKRGTSYACMRLVVLLAFATGVLLDAACGPYRGKGSGEISLLHSLLGGVRPGDVVLGDRYYGSYGLLALLRARGADGCFRLPVGREAEFHRGQPLGPDDYRHTWAKPEHRPKWLDRQTWGGLPEVLTVRVVRARVGRPGFRSQEVYVVTTLLDPVAYPPAEIARLYRERWHAELDLRALKQGLGAKLLRCREPARVRAELWANLLGYNLVRCALAQAAEEEGVGPRQLSFQGGVRLLDAFRWPLSGAAGAAAEVPAALAQALSTALAAHRVGDRPDRWEPREVKHRQRKYPELKKARGERKEELREPAAGRPEKGRGQSRPSGRQR
jgi:hypothetical protein